MKTYINRLNGTQLNQFQYNVLTATQKENYYSVDGEISENPEPKKYFQLSYTKKVGGIGSMTVKARNEIEALSNAKNICHTGKDFKVVGEVAPTKETAKGSGIAIGR